MSADGQDHSGSYRVDGNLGDAAPIRLPVGVPAFAIERSDLIKRVDLATVNRVVCVTAPAGYGKSLLLAQWSATFPDRAVGWVVIGARDADPHHFIERLASALESCWGWLPGQLLGRLYGSRADVWEQMSEIAAEVPETVVVLDDAEELSPLILAGLTKFVDHAPGGLHVVLSSRSVPSNLAAQAQRRGEVAFFTDRDLAFGRQEIGQLGECMSVDLAPPEIDELLTRTDGWPLAVQSALQSMRRDRTLTARGGDGERHLLRYLKDEVIGRLPEQLKQFAVTTSVVDDFSVALANALTGENTSAALIDQLMGRGVSLNVDARNATFSYPRLLRASLLDALRIHEPGRENVLFRLAGQWHLSHGELGRSVDYLLRAEAFEQAIMVIATNAPDLLRPSCAADVVSWLLRVPPLIRRANPTASVLLGAAHQLAGNLNEVDEIIGELGGNGEAGVSPWIDTLQCLGIEHHRGADEVVASAQHILDYVADVARGMAEAPKGLQREPDPFRAIALMSSVAYLAGGRALIGLGELGRAREWCSAGLADPTLIPRLHPQLVAVLGRAEALAGMLNAAEHHATQALAEGSENNAIDDVSRAEAYLVLGTVSVERLNLDAATHFLEEAKSRAEFNRRSNLLAAVVAQQARLALVGNRVDEGLTAIEQFYAAGWPDPPPAVAARLVAVEAGLRCAVGEPDRAAHLLAMETYVTADIAAARAQAAFLAQDCDVLLAVVGSWHENIGGAEPRSVAARACWAFRAAQLSGDADGGRHSLEDALRFVRSEGLRMVLFETGIDGFGEEASPVSCLDGFTPAESMITPAPRAQWSDIERWRTTLPFFEPLSEREIVVLRHLASDLDNVQVAAELFIAVNTLKTHLKHIYRKLGVKTRLQATLRATELGLLET